MIRGVFNFPDSKMLGSLKRVTQSAIQSTMNTNTRSIARPMVEVLKKISQFLNLKFAVNTPAVKVTPTGGAGHYTPINSVGDIESIRSTSTVSHGPNGITDATIEKMDTFRAAHNPGLTSEQVIKYIDKGAELFRQLSEGQSLPSASLDDVLSISWFTTAAAMQNGQELAKGSVRLPDPDQKVFNFLKSFENNTTEKKTGLPDSSVRPYARFSSHYNGTSGNTDKILGHDRQWGIESYRNAEAFPGGGKCILWNEMSSPGSDQKEIFIKFEESGFPLATPSNLANINGNPKFSWYQKMRMQFRDAGRVIGHCVNFTHGRGATGNVNTTTWKEHTATNKPLETLYKTTLKSISTNKALPKEIRDEAKTLLQELKDKQVFMGKMEENISGLADKMVKQNVNPDVVGAVSDHVRMISNGAARFINDHGHQTIDGMSRKGNEVHVDPTTVCRVPDNENGDSLGG